MKDIKDVASTHPIPINTVPVPIPTQKNTGTESITFKDEIKKIGYKKKTALTASNKSKKNTSFKY